MFSGVVVGRGRELAALTGDLTASVAGAGRVVVIEAPPGTGKTWLAEALLARAAGVTVVRAHCPDDEGAPVLWPWLQVFRRLGAGALPAGALDLGQAGAAARFQLFDEIATRLLATVPAAGLVLLIEDLHWADGATRLLLRHLAGEVASSPILVLVTTRPGAVSREVTAEVLRRPGGRLLELRPFGRSEVAEVLGVAGAVADEVWERSGGSPLLVAAVAKLLGDGEVPWERIARSADLGRLVSALTAGVPRRDLLRIAAVAGERIEPGLVAAAAGVPVAEVEETLAAAALGGAVVAGGPPVEYRFAHALIRDAVRAELTPRAEERLHRTLAGLLDENPRRAAHLLRAGGDEEVLRAAARACAGAAREAAAGLAFEDAARWWLRALGALERVGAEPVERAGLLLDLARAEYRGGDLGAARSHCEQAVALRPGDPHVLAGAALVLVGLGAPEVSHLVLEWCEGALAGGPLEPALTARVLAQKACALEELSRPDEAGEASARALELARAAADPDALLDAARARAMRLPRPDEITEQLELGALAIRTAALVDRPIAAVWGHVWRVDACLALGNFEQAAAETEAITRLARATRMPLARWFELRLHATRAQLEGRFDESAELSAEAGRLAVRIGDHSAAAMTGAHSLYAALVTGDPGRLAPGHADLLAAAPPLPIVRASVAATEFLLGRPDRARAVYEELRPLIRDGADQDRRRQGMLSLLTGLVVEFGDAEAAGWIGRALEPWAVLRGAPGSVTVVNTGSVLRDLGRLAAVEGRRDDAVRWLGQAVEVNTRLGARPYVVRARLELAELTGDGALATLAGREAARLGMPGAVASAARLTGAGTGPAELTRREREVVTLVADALSNREIADRLVLSERTVESHIRNILTKLGLSSRVQVARWVLEDHSS